jgi:predicted TPR repeat methyltransferase
MSQLANESTDHPQTLGTCAGVRFPARDGQLDQDEEWCEARIDGQWQRLRFHDYHEIYPVPGLYEALFYKRLRCCSPQRVVGLLDDVLSDFPLAPEDLRVLDVGAGNGMVGEELRKFGVSRLVGVDIIAEARDAAERDRPGVYDAYHIADLTELDPVMHSQVQSEQLNCMTVVAALGYGDIPPAAFIAACNLVDTSGWLAFNLKEDFLDEDVDPSGFSGLIRRLRREGIIQVQAYRRYCHRLSMAGQPLHYVAMVATKQADIPADLAEVFSA